MMSVVYRRVQDSGTARPFGKGRNRDAWRQQWFAAEESGQKTSVVYFVVRAHHSMVFEKR
jgi:hypothetical protein